MTGLSTGRIVLKDASKYRCSATGIAEAAQYRNFLGREGVTEGPGECHSLSVHVHVDFYLTGPGGPFRILPQTALHIYAAGGGAQLSNCDTVSQCVSFFVHLCAC